MDHSEFTQDQRDEASRGMRVTEPKNDREEGDRTGERGVVRENKGGRGRQGEEEG